MFGQHAMIPVLGVPRYDINHLEFVTDDHVGWSIYCGYPVIITNNCLSGATTPAHVYSGGWPKRG